MGTTTPGSGQATPSSTAQDPQSTATANATATAPTQPTQQPGTSGSWSDSMALGMPTTPQRWDGGSDFDIQVHTRNGYDVGNDPHLADHGADCGPPPAQHQISGWQDAVFICHDHVMTSILNDGYGEIVLTPDQLADWANGPVTISWSVSTFRTSKRDWLTLSLTPFDKQLALPFNIGGVDLHGMPYDFIQLEQGSFNDGTQWLMEQGANTFDWQRINEEWPLFNDQTGIQDSKATRTPFEFTFDSHSYLFRVAPNAPVGAGTVLLKGTFPHPLDFTRGVAQFAHHSYNAQKCAEGPMLDQPTCTGDTWHWSNFGISNAVSYYMAKPTDNRVVSGSAGVVSFAAPAPKGAYLKFAAIGKVEVSFDGGATYQPAVMPSQNPDETRDEQWNNFLTPVPAGTRQVKIRMTGIYDPPMARDFSIISQQ
ncbi:MAG TPA: hypothetical protein VHR15_04305 [Ktedonobacterales bacterium]|nr:hypothetical protein [Ktedonobacterales bacterium]